jgi:septum site-determining protein MinC
MQDARMTAAAAPAFRVKGSTLSATVLELAGTDAVAFERALADTVETAPQLFREAPVVLALDKLDNEDGPLDLETLLAICRRHSLRPVGLRARRADDLLQAAALGMPVLPLRREREPMVAGGAEGGIEAAPAEAAADLVLPHAGGAAVSHCRIVTTPVRGGQQLYVPGDLVLLAPVSAGAEVLAGGHIHVYAPLRGRALAGVQGDTRARIFCRELQAELVAIAGRYRTADELRDDPLWGRSAQLLLENEEMRILPL